VGWAKLGDSAAGLRARN
jgi:hypothetical protein